MPLYQPNHTLLNRYRIERFIGAGAFAEVYLATHLKLNALYALKILNKDVPGLGSTEFGDYRQRFQLEAQLGAALRHPHIVPAYDFEEEGDTLILRMAYAAGGSLDERLKDAQGRRQALAVEDAVRIVQEVAQGLGALHELDAVHRDVKPSNILFDDKGRAMLADLGLAQAPGGPSMRSVMSQAMSHPGTPAYMSPEQLGSFGHLGPSSDVYSLGAVLFEMLTGRLYKNVRPGTAVTKYRKDAPDWLVEALGRMLAKSPEDRPWDGEEMAEMLQVEKKRKRLEHEAAIKAKQEAEEKARRETEARKQAEEDRKQREREAVLVKKQAAEKTYWEAKGKAHNEAEEDRKRQERETEEKAKKAAAERARRAREEGQREREPVVPIKKPRHGVQYWPWRLVLIEGIALAILGALLLFWNTAATWTTLVWILGIYWIIGGVIKFISMFQDHEKWGWKPFLGILYIIAGLFLVASPLYGGYVFDVAVILVIGIYAIILGIVSLIDTFKGEGPRILGAITIVLGIWLLMNIGASILALPWAVGILSLIGGGSAIVIAFRLR